MRSIGNSESISGKDGRLILRNAKYHVPEYKGYVSDAL